MTDRQLALRIFLTGVVLALGAAPLLSSCAVVFPVEQGPIAEVLASRYVTDEMRAAHADLHSPAMERAIAEARR